ncbi:MAG: iron-containing redox enzyme family protein [Solirubrobacterales bacterium]|nr:iron-containing redox enzyme family protein [Solirubrobacterales bacterium]MBV9424563.1 iron-containing redox enzyme family protein [Solirubrobacterales bacterium]MBV9798083.1 iron-containing redox enzyme family protein [Solirubrobacterales bacterium]
MTRLPSPRGSVSDVLLHVLPHEPGDLPHVELAFSDEPLADEDLQLSLYLCYELHYRGLPGVDDRWEWEPSLLALRKRLEQRFERALLSAVPLSDGSTPIGDIDLALRAIAEREHGPSLSSYIRLEASLDQVKEFLVHRSAYQLKEADPHSWAIPRLTGRPKAALIEIQADEYGGGRAEWIHADLFARAMHAVGLDATYGAYLELIPGVTLATVNLMSLLGLHRRWRGAIAGHLALFEMTSSIPNRRYGDGLRRLGFDGDATLFFDEHVVADAVHENVASVDLAGGLVRQDPTIGASILWGAQALDHLDAAWAAHLLGCWRDGRSSLLESPSFALGGGLTLTAG